MAATSKHRASAKRLVGSIFLGVLLASVTWLSVGYITRTRDESNRREAKQMYPELIRGDLSTHNLERARYLLHALPTSQDRTKLYGFLFSAALVKIDNRAKVLPIMIELTHDPNAHIRSNTAQMAAYCGKGDSGVQQRLQQMAQSDGDAEVRNQAQKCLIQFNRP